MRVSRLAIALAAVACAVALPAAAAAHKSKPANHGHHGKGDNGTVVRLAPVTGQKAKGAAVLTQHTGAVSFALVVARLTPGLLCRAPALRRLWHDEFRSGGAARSLRR